MVAGLAEPLSQQAEKSGSLAVEDDQFFQFADSAAHEPKSRPKSANNASTSNSRVLGSAADRVRLANMPDRLADFSFIKLDIPLVCQRDRIVWICGERRRDIFFKRLNLEEPIERIDPLRNDRAFVADQIARDDAFARFGSGHDRPRTHVDARDFRASKAADTADRR